MAKVRASYTPYRILLTVLYRLEDSNIEVEPPSKGLAFFRIISVRKLSESLGMNSSRLNDNLEALVDMALVKDLRWSANRRSVSAWLVTPPSLNKPKKD